MPQFFRDFAISWWVFLIETDRKHYKGYKILIQYTFAYIVNRIQYIYIYKCISVYKSVYLDGNENR